MIFIDTSWFYAVEVEADINHNRALKCQRQLMTGKFGAPYTTNYIIDETLTLLRVKAGYKAALNFKEKVEGSQALRVVWIGPELLKVANEIFRTYPDLALSFTDCTSFAVMRELGIRQALTYDQDFSVLGFETVG